MNMKKTMAAIAAGSVAVSAMATTVSALPLETKTLHYNLVQSVKNDTKGDADYTVQFPSIALEVGDKVTVNVIGFGGNDEVTIRPNYNDSTYYAPSWTYTNNKDSVKYNPTLDPASDTMTFNTVEKNSTERNAFVGGTENGTVASWTLATATDQVIVRQQQVLDTALAAQGDVTLTYVTDAAVNTAVAALATTVVDGAATQLKTLNSVSGVTGWYVGTPASATDAVNAAIATLDLTAVVSQADLTAAIKAQYGTPKSLADYGVVILDVAGTGAGTAPANGDVIKLAKGSPALCTIFVDVLDKDFVADDFAAVNAALQAGTGIGVSLKVEHADGSADTIIKNGASVLNAFTGNKSVEKYPYMSSLNNTIYQYSGATGTTATYGAHGGDVLEHIWTVKDDDNSTHINAVSVRAVINDAIQQHNGNVTFVFNTAAKKVKVTDTCTNSWYKTGLIGAYADDWAGSAEGVEDFTSFGNHYYNNLQYGYDANLDYYVNNWKPDNLFNGLLLVNSNLTLSLSDTEKFDWTEKSLSFTWEAIEDSALTANQYANYVQNMVLRTSQNWYWDSLDVVLADVETAGIGVGAPTDAPEEDIDDEEEDVEDFEEPDEPEEPADEPEEPADEPAEVAPAVVNNPTTGNASVALAVIPVALAAAAIVAKKRG